MKGNPRGEGMPRGANNGKRKNRIMKLMAQLAVIGALAAGVTAVNAQTNIDVNVNIALNGVVQTGDTAAKGKISTKDVIQALVPGASPKAKLVLRGSPDGGTTFVVVDGETVTDVSGQVSTGTPGNSVTVETTKGSVITDKTVEIREFILSNTSNGLAFDVQGYTSSTSDNRGLHGEVFDSTFPSSASAKVAGNITDANGNPGVAQGTISIGGRKITEAAE